MRDVDQRCTDPREFARALRNVADAQPRKPPAAEEGAADEGSIWQGRAEETAPGDVVSDGGSSDATTQAYQAESPEAPELIEPGDPSVPEAQPEAPAALELREVQTSDSLGGVGTSARRGRRAATRWLGLGAAVLVVAAVGVFLRSRLPASHHAAGSADHPTVAASLGAAIGRASGQQRIQPVVGPAPTKPPPTASGGPRSDAAGRPANPGAKKPQKPSVEDTQPKPGSADPIRQNPF